MPFWPFLLYSSCHRWLLVKAAGKTKATSQKEGRCWGTTQPLCKLQEALPRRGSPQAGIHSQAQSSLTVSQRLSCGCPSGWQTPSLHSTRGSAPLGFRGPLCLSLKAATCSCSPFSSTQKCQGDKVFLLSCPSFPSLGLSNICGHRTLLSLGSPPPPRPQALTLTG